MLLLVKLCSTTMTKGKSGSDEGNNMHFDVAGPFEITRYGTKKNITKQSLTDLKDHFEAWEEGLSSSCGCYVFAKRAGGGIIPWYVGKACCLPMFKEALSAENITKYNTVLDDKGTPLLFVIPLRTPKGKLRKRPESGDLPSVSFLERWLIATALDRNPELINNKETKFLRNLHVVGIFNPTQGESTSASQELKKTLGR
jgi:hypothetical protein